MRKISAPEEVAAPAEEKNALAPALTGDAAGGECCPELMMVLIDR